MINTITKAIKSIFSIEETIDENSVVCSIDEETVSCDQMEDCMPPWGHCDLEYVVRNPITYTGVPAPKYLKDDDWFGPAVISDENKDYMEREYQAFKEEAHKFYGTKESESIHQDMYEIATASQNTTIQLDTPGGSENFHGDWQSGAGTFS